MALDRAKLATNLSTIELERVDALFELVDVGAQSELADLGPWANEEDDGTEFYAEEAQELHQVTELFGQLAAVALYSVVEIRTKNALSWKATTSEMVGLFKFAELKKVFLKYAKTPLSTLPAYQSVDELRCISNCFKHAGRVSAELAAYPGWTKGAALGDVRSALKKLRPTIPRYLSALFIALGP
jgi:hypothetical protein